MNRHTEALFCLSKLISPVENFEDAKKIVLSESTPWQGIIDFANQHLLIPTLYSAFIQKDLMHLVPDKLIVEYLTTLYGYNKARNEAIVKQLEEMCYLFSTIGVKPILLKGAVALSEGYYSHIGARVMMDVDILVPEDKIEKCVGLLETARGYKPVDPEKPLWHNHQYRRIYSERDTAALELHRYPLNSACRHYFSETELIKHIRPSKTVENAYVLEPSFDLYLIFLHSELHDAGHKKGLLSMRSMHHAAVIVSSCKKELDWTLPAVEISKHSLAKEWGDYLYVLNRLFDIQVPEDMIGSPKHYIEVTGAIEKMDESTWTRLKYFFIVLRNGYAYKKHKLQLQNQSKNRLVYPLVMTYSFIEIFIKFSFSSSQRKKLVDFFTNRISARKYGQ